MIGIVMLHTQSKTGWLEGKKIGMVSWLGSWGIQAICMLTVNIYMLISGYFLPGARRTTKKIFDLWCIASFWSLFSVLLEAVFTKKQISIVAIVNRYSTYLNTSILVFDSLCGTIPHFTFFRPIFEGIK